MSNVAPELKSGLLRIAFASGVAIEHAPPEKRGRYGVFTALGSPAGTILANGAFALVLLPETAPARMRARVQLSGGAP